MCILHKDGWFFCTNLSVLHGRAALGFGVNISEMLRAQQCRPQSLSVAYWASSFEIV